MCYALGCMLFILCWAGRPASEDRPGAPEAPRLHIGIVHQGAVYATDRSTAVYRGEAFGPELRVCRIGPADPTGQVWESVDFPPRWKVGQGMLVFANADSHDRWGSHYGYHARAFYTYAISLAQIEKRIVDERGTAREKNDDWVAAAKEEEFVDCLLHDRNANLLHAILLPTLLYRSSRAKLDSE